MLGLPPEDTVSPERAAWANGTAVRELDFHDTFLTADDAHPDDTIPPLLALAQHTGATGTAAGPRPRPRRAAARAERSRARPARGDPIGLLEGDPGLF